jgi:predicted nucleic acid-binding protein
MSVLCVDTGVLISYCNRDDIYHPAAQDFFADYFGEQRKNHLLVAWPVSYETVRTKTVKSRVVMETLRSLFVRLRARERLLLFDDRPYRDLALDDCFAEVDRSRNGYRSLSLADRVLRGIVSDTRVRVDAVVTWNIADFSDVCRKRGVELLPYQSGNSRQMRTVPGAVRNEN